MYTSFDTLSGVGQTTAVELSGMAKAARLGRQEASVQVVLTGAAIVDIEARVDASLAWAKVETGITENKIVRIGHVDAVRLNVTSRTSGTIGGGVLI
jgi:hypothetical protein